MADSIKLISRFAVAPLTIASAWLLIGTTPSKTTTGSAAVLTQKDRTFMTNIAHRGFEELAMAKLAEKQARSAGVTNFAKQLTVTRSAINDQLIALAARKNYPIAKENLGTVIAHNPKLGALAWGAGYAGPGGVMSNYDKRWTSDMETALRNELSDCADEAKNGTDPDVKAWATKTFETIRKDLVTLMDIRAS